MSLFQLVAIPLLVGDVADQRAQSVSSAPGLLASLAWTLFGWRD